MIKIIFTKEHLELIIKGKKTQTRRVGKKRWSIGKEYSARTNRFREAEHYIRIISIHIQPLNKISEYDARKEGGYTPQQFIKGFCEMHKKRGVTPYDLVWIIHFVYIGKKRSKK